MADIEMSNEEIINEFDNLFGSDDDQTTTVDDTKTETQEDDTEDDSSSNESEDTTEDTTEDSTEDTEDQEQLKESPEDKKRKQQNFAFAEMRNKLKEKDSFIEDLAKSIGLDKNLSTDEKQAKETGVPLETLQRLEVLEARDREYQFSKRQQQTQDAIAGLVEKYSLDSGAVNGFVQQLVENGKNPLEVDGVDLETEYLKLNFQSIMQAQIDAAVQAERDRSKKATDKSASGVDTGPGDGETEKKINSVKDLDNLFNGMDL